ncbi:MAG: deoxyhypusine synthase [Thermoprotei archaeon]
MASGAAQFRRRVLAKKISDIKCRKDMTVTELLEGYGEMGGFGARMVSDARNILDTMVRDGQTTRFLSFTADLVATGLRGVFVQMIKSKMFDAVITTCGTLDHDIARANGGRYCFGSFDADDVELKRAKINRLGNIFIPMEDYGQITERFVYKALDKAVEIKSTWGVRELLDLMGGMCQDQNSILRAAHDAGVKVYVPGIVDGAVGTHAFMYSQTKKFGLDLFRDMKELSDMVFDAKKTGALIVGGGISKHHTIWWNQFRDGLDYAVYLTTASEYDGSLSGARPKEAISWNKIKPSAKHAVVLGDATVTLPLLACSIFG